MDKITVLVLPGGNEIEIISMVFKNFKSGVEYVKNVLGKEPDKIKDSEAIWDAYDFFNGKSSRLKEGETKPNFRNSEGKTDYKAEREWVKNNGDKFTEEIKADYDKIRKIVTGYYGGCGEAWRIVIKEVDFATPLCKFDFD